MPESRNFTMIVSTVALLGSAASLGMLFGSVMGRVERAENDIKQIEADGRSAQVTLNQIDLRTARMEAKLEILLSTSSLEGGR